MTVVTSVTALVDVLASNLFISGNTGKTGLAATCVTFSGCKTAISRNQDKLDKMIGWYDRFVTVLTDLTDLSQSTNYIHIQPVIISISSICIYYDKVYRSTFE